MATAKVSRGAEYTIPEQVVLETSSIFEVSESTYTEIIEMLTEAGMQDRMVDDGDFEIGRDWLLDMRGVALRKKTR